MAPSPHDAKVQAAWAAHRPYLLAVAAGMLKGRDDAEDVVQEAFARLAASPVGIGLGPVPGVRGAEAVAERAMHLFGRSAGVSLEPFDLEGRAAVVVRRGEEVVAVARLDDREGRISHLHTFARPSLAR